MHIAEGRVDPDDTNHPGPDHDDITLGESLQSGPPLQTIVFADVDFLQAVRDGYKDDRMYAKMMGDLAHYKSFRSEEGLLYTKNRMGTEVVCIPRALHPTQRSLTEMVITHAHDTLGHLGFQKTSEYARRWFWW
ncbi:hypothetical protein FIBSPDRAFT_756326, partial [Athelia psychrophila]